MSHRELNRADESFKLSGLEVEAPLRAVLNYVENHAEKG